MFRASRQPTSPAPTASLEFLCLYSSLVQSQSKSSKNNQNMRTCECYAVEEEVQSSICKEITCPLNVALCREVILVSNRKGDPEFSILVTDPF